MQKLKQALLGHHKNLHIIENFLPQAEYATLLCSCRVGIFGHLRQQAVGNILICMLQGSKVFLWRDSIAYKYLKKAGYLIYTIDDELTNDNVNTLMTKEERELNRKLALKQFTFTPVLDRLDNFLFQVLES